MIHIFHEKEGDWSVWTDCEPGHYRSGRCVGTAKDKFEALQEASLELEKDISMLMRGTAPEIDETKEGA